MLIALRHEGFTHPRFLRPFGGGAKRLTDIIIAILALVISAVPMILTAAAIKLLDDGSILFTQRRVGLDGSTFTLLKFRTMVPDGPTRLAQVLREDSEAAREWAEKQKLSNDPRITPLGRFLRRSSLDELPQLVNVLLGHMSIVGPRPMLPEQVGLYGAGFDAYCSARPGLTGLWQVSGRNHTSFRVRAKLDEAYLERWSMGEDLSLMVRTAGVLIGNHGAC